MPGQRLAHRYGVSPWGSDVDFREARSSCQYTTQGERTMSTNTVRLHRVLRCPPQHIYRAFTEPAAFERWLPPFGFTGNVHGMDPVVGGEWRMSFTTFGSGHSHSFGGKYLEL